MRILLVHPGASVSTADVYTGYAAALARAGVEVIPYTLDGRIDFAGRWLNYLWRKAQKANQDIVRPNKADILHLACNEIPWRAHYYGVDWVVVVSAMYVPPFWLDLLRRMTGLKLGIVFTESPYDDERQLIWAERADAAWTNERTSVERLSKACRHTFYLPHAYDPARHHPYAPVDESLPAHDVVFVGTLFRERIELLNAVNWDGIDFGLYGENALLGSRNPLRRYVRGQQMDNAEAVKLYRRAKIGLNLYRQSRGFGKLAPFIDVPAESLNPRAYELAACGVYQISEARAETREVLGATVPQFSTPAELEEWVRLSLDDSEMRWHYAGQARQNVQGCTFDDRAKQMLGDMERSQRVRVYPVAQPAGVGV